MREIDILRGLGKARASLSPTKPHSNYYAEGTPSVGSDMDFRTPVGMAANMGRSLRNVLTPMRDAPAAPPAAAPQPVAEMQSSGADSLVAPAIADRLRGGLGGGAAQYAGGTANAGGPEPVPRTRIGGTPIQIPNPLEIVRNGLGLQRVPTQWEPPPGYRSATQPATPLADGRGQLLRRGTAMVKGKRGVDKVPAMLTRGEAVLPVQTVKKVGAQNIARLIADTNNEAPRRGLREGGRYASGFVEDMGNMYQGAKDLGARGLGAVKGMFAGAPEIGPGSVVPEGGTPGSTTMSGARYTPGTPPPEVPPFQGGVGYKPNFTMPPGSGPASPHTWVSGAGRFGEAAGTGLRTAGEAVGTAMKNTGMPGLAGAVETASKLVPAFGGHGDFYTDNDVPLQAKFAQGARDIGNIGAGTAGGSALAATAMGAGKGLIGKGWGGTLAGLALSVPAYLYGSKLARDATGGTANALTGGGGNTDEGPALESWKAAQRAHGELAAREAYLKEHPMKPEAPVPAATDAPPSWPGPPTPVPAQTPWKRPDDPGFMPNNTIGYPTNTPATQLPAANPVRMTQDAQGRPLMTNISPGGSGVTTRTGESGALTGLSTASRQPFTGMARSAKPNWQTGDGIAASRAANPWNTIDPSRMTLEDMEAHRAKGDVGTAFALKGPIRRAQEMALEEARLRPQMARLQWERLNKNEELHNKAVEQAFPDFGADAQGNQIPIANGPNATKAKDALQEALSRYKDPTHPQGARLGELSGTELRSLLNIHEYNGNIDKWNKSLLGRISNLFENQTPPERQSLADAVTIGGRHNTSTTRGGQTYSNRALTDEGFMPQVLGGRGKNKIVEDQIKQQSAAAEQRVRALGVYR